MIPPPVLPIIAVPAFMLGVAALLYYLSGWGQLAGRYPNAPYSTEAPKLIMRGQSGSVAGLRFNGILRFEVCPSGLRISVSKVLFPFGRTIFIPWDEITPTAEADMINQLTRLSFGPPSETVGSLQLYRDVAARLTEHAPETWRGRDLVKPVPHETIVRSIVRTWLLLSLTAATFFTVIPRIAAPPGARPPIIVAILFPTVVCGLWALLEYHRRTRR